MGLLLLIFIGFIYTSLQTTSIYGGDAGDLVTAAFLKGVPHPPGYPLYTAIGHFLTKIIPGTAAYSVSFLSTIPSIFTVLLIYLISKRLTKNSPVSVISSLTLAFSYLFWLYSETPEVFSLHIFFIALIIYILIVIYQKPSAKLLYLLSLAVGLSLSHHHTIVFLFPSIIYWFFLIRKKIKPIIVPRKIIIMGIFFLVGLLPYSYLPIAASANPPLNWDDPVNLTNFIRLVTRADYGSFTAGGYVLNTPFARIYQFKAYFRFLVTEFTLVGFLIAIVGCIYQFIKRRLYWKLLFTSFIMLGPFFLFYAAFPLAVDFGLATYERFLLPSYLFIAIWMGEGVLALSLAFNKIFNRFLGKTSVLPIAILTQMVFLIFPISFFIAHYPKIKSLKNDRTAENTGYDILNTVPQNSIIILAGDTSLFNTQYEYYTQKVRPDVILIHYSKMYQEYYLQDLKNHYQNLNIPGEDDEPISAFFEKNSDLPIYSAVAIPGSGGYWVRNGLLLRHFKNESDIPNDREILAINEDLWSKYHNPLDGALSIYNHLMLSDSTKVYADSLYDYAQGLFRIENYIEALPIMEKAITYQPYDEKNLHALGIAYFKTGNCDKALEYEHKTIDLFPNVVEAYEQLSLIYKECFSDNQKSEYYKNLFEEKKAEQDTKLETI